MGFANVVITAPYAATFPVVGVDLLAGSPNPLYGLVTFLHDSVPKSDRYTADGQTYVWNANLLLEMLTIDLMTAVSASGADFLQVPLFFAIDLAANVPAPWAGTDENGDPVDRTWQEFFDATPTREPIAIGEDVYTSTLVDGEYLPFTEAASLGLTLITKSEFDAIPRPEADA